MDEPGAPPHPQASNEGHLIVFRGGVRDGQLTRVSHAVTSLLTPSEAPGLLDVYERLDETVFDQKAGADAAVFEMVDQRSAEGIAPELLHQPGDTDVPGAG